MLIFGRDNWPPHRRWALFALLLVVAGTVGYFGWAVAVGRLPAGSSVPGFACGVVGGLIIVFECLLWWRKNLVRVWRIGRTQTWLRAHIWLGLACLPLLVWHSGLRLGGPLSTTLLILLVVVIVSGVWGLAVQQFLPTRLLQGVPAETIYSQIGFIVRQMAEEADRVVDTVCGPAEGRARAEPAEMSVAERAAGEEHLVYAAVRSEGRVQGKVLETRTPFAPVDDAEPLRAFYEAHVRPFLREEHRANGDLRSPLRAAVLFRDLRTRLPAAASPAVDVLEKQCEQRRQFYTQARLQWLLHSWLWVHLPLSAALLVLMLVHVWVALKYW